VPRFHVSQIGPAWRGAKLVSEGSWQLYDLSVAHDLNVASFFEVLLTACRTDEKFLGQSRQARRSIVSAELWPVCDGAHRSMRDIARVSILNRA
jgi:hypothetical protein